VLLCWPFAFPEVSVAAVREAAFSKYLSQGGIEIITVAPKKEGLQEVERSPRIIRVTSYESPSPPGGILDRLLAFRRSVREIRQLLEEFQPNLVIASSPPPFLAYETLRAMAGNEVPYIFDSRDAFAQTSYYLPNKRRAWAKLRLERKCCRAAQRIFAVTERQAELLAQGHGLSPESVLLVPNGADLEFFSRPPRPARCDFVMHGVPKQMKEITSVFRGFLEALQDAPEMRIRYVGWTDSDYCRGIEQEIRAQGRESSFELIPPVPFEEIPQLLSEGRVGVASHSKDPAIIPSMPVETYEYVAAGLPVVAHGPDVPCALRDYVTGEGVGVYATSINAFARACIRFLGEPGFLHSFSPGIAASRVKYDRGRILKEVIEKVIIPFQEKAK